MMKDNFKKVNRPVFEATETDEIVIEFDVPEDGQIGLYEVRAYAPEPT